jgi:hypothetical protein
MRSYDLILEDGRRVRVVRARLPEAVVLTARAGGAPGRPVVARGELRLPPPGGSSGEVSLSVESGYAGSGLDYRLGALLLLAGREAGLDRVVARLRPEDEPGIRLFQRLGAGRAWYQSDLFVHEVPLSRRSRSVRSGTWMLDLQGLS